MASRDELGRFAGADYVPNPQLAEALKQEPEMTRALMSVADRIVTAARGEAPVKSGKYAARLRSVYDDGQVRAESFDPAGHLVEFGSINNEAYAPLRRGAAMVARFDEAPKP